MEVKLSVAKIATGVFTSLLIGAVLGAFALVRTSDNLVIRVGALERTSDNLEERFVSRTEFNLTIENQNDKLETINNKLDRINSRL